MLARGFTDTAVVEALTKVGLGLDVDRVYIFENRSTPEGQTLTSQRYEWSRSGVQAQIDNPELQDLLLDDLVPDWLAAFSTGTIINGLVHEMEPAIREFLEAQSIRSILVSPIYVNASTTAPRCGSGLKRTSRRWQRWPRASPAPCERPAFAKTSTTPARSCGPSSTAAR